MPAPRLFAIVTALILMYGHTALAEYSLAQLQEIERYILTRNNAALLLLLQANPDLMVGDDPLAQELRTFMETNMQQQFLWFNAPTATLPPPELALGQVGHDQDDIY